MYTENQENHTVHPMGRHLLPKDGPTKERPGMPENARRDVLNARESEEDSPSEILVIIIYIQSFLNIYIIYME